MNALQNIVNSSEDICLYAKKNAPRLLSIGSSVLAAGACAGTGIATWKAKERFEEHNANIADLHEDLRATNKPDEQAQIKRDILMEYGKTAGTVIKYYSIPAILLGGSIACDIASSKAYEHKIALASGALLLLKGAYDKAQERAKEKYGAEEAADIFYGSKEKQIETVDENGNKIVKTIKEYDGNAIFASNPCVMLLGDGIKSNLNELVDLNPSLREMRLSENIRIIQSLEREFTYKLNYRGYVTVQQVYERLGLEWQSKAQHDLWSSWGWIMDYAKVERFKRDCEARGVQYTDEDIYNQNRVDLGLFNEANQNYISGDEPVVWIIPNCIGDIMPLIFPTEKDLVLLNEAKAK